MKTNSDSIVPRTARPSRKSESPGVSKSGFGISVDTACHVASYKQVASSDPSTSLGNGEENSFPLAGSWAGAEETPSACLMPSRCSHNS